VGNPQGRSSCAICARTDCLQATFSRCSSYQCRPMNSPDTPSLGGVRSAGGISASRNVLAHAPERPRIDIRSIPIEASACCARTPHHAAQTSRSDPPRARSAVARKPRSSNHRQRSPVAIAPTSTILRDSPQLRMARLDVGEGHPRSAFPSTRIGNCGPTRKKPGFIRFCFSSRSVPGNNRTSSSALRAAAGSKRL